MSMAALGLQWQSCKAATKSYDPQTLKKSPFGPLSLQTPDLNIYCILQSKTHSKLIQKAVKKKKKKKYKQEEDLGKTEQQEAPEICLPTWTWISAGGLCFLSLTQESWVLCQANLVACEEAARADPPQFLTVNTGTWLL